MKASELRIGNYVTDEDGFIYNVDISVLQNPNEFESIPLTEEWLLKFGFDDTYYTFNKSSVKIDWAVKVIESGIRSVFTLESEEFNISIRHVHQLQNLYFALTGKELKMI